MPSIIYGDRWDSGAASWGAEDENLELIYPVANAADPDEALVFINGIAPLAVVRPSGRTVVRQNLAVAVEDGGIHTVTGTYGLRKPREAGDYDFTFDTTGGTKKLTQSLATIARYPKAGATAPDFKGAIGVTADGVEGVDVQDYKFAWTETHEIPLAAATFAYALTLRAVTGKTNAGTFRGFAAGTVIFRGATGGKKSEDTASITFAFEAGEHATGLTVGAITGIDKKAWEYLWVRYEEAVDTAAKATVRTPLAAYVEKVADEADFSALGIGS